MRQEVNKTTTSKRTPSKDGKKFGVRPTVKGDVQSNQWQATQRQQAWLKFYMDPREKPTWGNAYQSAISAGYSETYARNILSDSVALQWVQQARNIMRLNPEHLKLSLVQIINSDMARDSDKIQAIKLLGTDQGMFVQKQITAHIGLEEALNELE